MAIQLVRDQLINSIIDTSKLADESVSFAKILASDIETSISGGAQKLATAGAIKAYVDSRVPDAFSGGDGIAIDASGDPDVISVDLATNPGMQFTSNKLDLKLANGTLTKDANGLTVGQIANAQISNSAAIAISKLAASTISSKALGTNLDSVTPGDGLQGNAYNGSANQTFSVKNDGSTISVGAGGIKVADGGITPGQLAFQSRQDVFTPNGSTSAFNLTTAPSAPFFNFVMVFRNGLLQKKVAGSAGADEYVVSESGGTVTVTFGANVPSGGTLEVRYLA
jgi:hypothetical protein